MSEQDIETPAESSSTATAKSNGNHNHHQRGVPSSSALRQRLTHIPAKQPVLLRLPSGKFKSVELHPGKVVSLGKFGSFKAEDIIGLPYGLTYEIVNNTDAAASGTGDGSGEGKGKGKKSKADDLPGSLKVVISQSITDMEETSATNELINDDQASQTLTMLDIQTLKELGLHGRDIVQKGVEGNSSFQQRTSWSQQKYVMRKESKHLQLFTPLPPTMTNLCGFFNEKFDREADKLRGLRGDSLANILSLAGVAPGGRYIVVDGVGGLVAGAMLERMGGEGRLLALNDADSPPAFDLLSYMGLPISTVNPVLKSLHWANTEKDWTPALPMDESDELTPTGKAANDRDKQRFRKRKAQALELERTRQELFDGDFDGLVVACAYETVSIVDRLLPYLGGSSHIVIHHPFQQPLTEAHAQLRLYHSLIDVAITEPFMRRYQVLPGRMHPEMTTSATGGYILHAIRVYTDEETRAILAREKEREKQVTIVVEDEHPSKRPRLEEGASDHQAVT